MKSVSFATLGCKVNQYETEAMTAMFRNAGYIIKDFNEICDIYIINTCTVTGTGERKSRQFIRRASKINPKAFVAVVGCYSQVSPTEASKIEGVSLVLGTKDKSRIVEICEDAIEREEKVVVADNILKARDYEDMSVTSYSSRTRAFVKIEDGCNEFCTYCIIPYARGPVRSRSLKSILDEVNALSKNGFSEIVLTGIHLASYGKDTKEATLLDVIRGIADIDGIKRIRLGSVEPRLLTEEFVKEIASIDKMCNHFHIALQSGCDKTLLRMNRKYKTEDYMKGVDLVRRYFDEPAIATDIMVGFPGETDEEFAFSLEFAKAVDFADAHVFAYSNRKGTKADSFPNQVPKSVKEQRSRILIDELAKSQRRYLDLQIGKRKVVLFEQEISKGVYEGHMTNYVKVHLATDEDVSGQYIEVEIVKANSDFVDARLV